MKKLCLILTVLYAFGANCSAQSSLNIAKNLLEGNSSTFNSDWGGWGDQGDYCGKSLESTDGFNGSQYARLTPKKEAPNDYDAQLTYNFAATKGTTYVFRLKAKKVSGNGTIQAIMQHNSDGFEQQHFFDKDVSENWATYEGEVTAERSDYNVIMINYGKCGDVLIDDIEFGVKTDNVAPTFTTNLDPSYTVGQSGTLDLTVEASGTPAPTYQWYRNTTNSNENGTIINDETSATYSVPTGTKGTYYYYCVAKNAEGSAGSTTSNVATVNVTDPIQVTGISLFAPNTMNVGTNAQCIVTIDPDNATNKNVTWESSDVSIIEVDQNGNLTAKSTGTATITVRSQDGGQHVSKEIKVNASTSTNGTVVDGGMFYMVQDFGNATMDATWEIIYSDPNVTQHGSATIVADPAGQKGNVLRYEAANNDKTEFLVFDCVLPAGKKLSDYSNLVFDYKMSAVGEANYKDINIYWSDVDWSGKTYPKFTSQDEQGAGYPWHTAQISLKDLPTPKGNTFKIYIGGIPTYKCQVFLSNVRLGIGDYNQNDLTNTWSKVESETLYVTGSGPMPDFNGNQPWIEKNNSITKVIVSENITAIGDNAFKDLTKDNVVIILKSIPDKFGENCFSDGSHSRILELELHDSEKPYISKKKVTEIQNFPTFNKTTYFRDVTNTYSTVCLPFPVADETVTEAGAELFDFTSIKKNGEQYTLAFKKHSGGMAAGQTYLIKKHDIEGTLQNTDVTKEQFNLTPSVSTNTVENSDPSFSISMTGVFQPSVFGPNLGTDDAPVYAYGFQNEKFYMNGGNMSVRPMRGYFYGSQLYSAPVQGGQQQSGAKKMPNMFNFEIVPDNVTHISSPAFIAEDFNIEEVYSPSGMKTKSLNKGLNIIRTSTGRVLKVMVK
jgi:hypothetical protein